MFSAHLNIINNNGKYVGVLLSVLLKEMPISFSKVTLLPQILRYLHSLTYEGNVQLHLKFINLRLALFTFQQLSIHLAVKHQIREPAALAVQRLLMW